jgi:hypothetical protein
MKLIDRTLTNCSCFSKLSAMIADVKRLKWMLVQEWEKAVSEEERC